MSKTYETGLAKNIANFETLISVITSYGATYNPSRAALQLTNMQLQATAAKTAIANYNQQLPNYSNAVADREIAFQSLNTLSTRILNSLKATEASKQVIDNATTNHRKLKGRRASTKLTEEQKNTLAAQGKEVKQISTSQLSYDSLLNNFDKQIQLLASIPQYTPNETDLQVTSLKALYTDLETKNAQVVNQTILLSNARYKRNNEMYNIETGVVAIASNAKTYIKSLFGLKDPNYKQISALPFRVPRP